MKQVLLSLSCAFVVAIVSGCDAPKPAVTTPPATPAANVGHSGVGGTAAPTSEKPAAKEMPADPKPVEPAPAEPKPVEPAPATATDANNP